MKNTLRDDIKNIGKSWLTKAFNLSVLEKSRMNWVDYLRGIAIILVVYHHVNVGLERSGIKVDPAIVNANMIFYSFRMPLFFILSGIFIGYSLPRKTATQIIWNKFEKLLYPYLIWSFIQITLQIFLSHFTNSDRSLIDYTYILYQPRKLDQFWYLPALFNTTLFYLIIKTKLKPSAGSDLAIGLLFYFISPFLQDISIISDWMRFYIFFALGNVLSVYFFREKFQRFLNNPWSLPAILPLFFISQLYYLKQEVGTHTIVSSDTINLANVSYLHNLADDVSFLFIALIGCLTILLLAFRLQKWNVFSFLRVFGYHSLYIYVMHVMVFAFTRIVLINIFHLHNVIALLLIGITAGITIPVIFYNQFVHNNFGWFLFSYHKKQPAQQITATRPRPKIIA